LHEARGVVDRSFYLAIYFSSCCGLAIYFSSCVVSVVFELSVPGAIRASEDIGR